MNERSSTSKVGRVMRSFESHTLSSVDGPLPSFLAGGRPSLVCARPGAASCPPEYKQGEVRRGALCVCGVRLPDGRDNDDVHCHQDEVRRASSGISTTATHGRPAAGWRAAPPFRAAVPSELRGRRQRHPRASVITFRTASGRTISPASPASPATPATPGTFGNGTGSPALAEGWRVAYWQILDDERKGTAAGFSERANAFFPNLGVPVTAVDDRQRRLLPVPRLR